LSLAYELAAYTGCELLSTRRPFDPWATRSVADVTAVLFPWVAQHIEAHGSRPHPVAGIHVALGAFAGTEWAEGETPPHRSQRYLDTRPGDILIEASRTNIPPEGWGYGTLISGDIHQGSTCGWYPPSISPRCLGGTLLAARACSQPWW
jgi:hypothetical protein